MKTSFFTAILSLFFVLVSQAQVVFSLNKSTFAPGETIVATWSGRSTPSTTDWVGIYPTSAGIPDGNPASTIWKYTNGAAAGSVSFASPGLAAREWVAYLLANDGYTVLASFPFTVSNAAKINAFTADHSFINDGTPITLSWVIDPGTTGLQTLTLSDGSTETNVAALDVLEVSPSQNTTYTLTLNGNTSARSTVFKDAGNSAAFNLGNATHFSTGQTLNIAWNAATANSDSWVGIYRAGESPSTNLAVSWNYLNGTKTAGGDKLPNGSLPFNLVPGEYYAVLFTDSGYLIEQGPIRFSVTDQPIKDFAVTTFGQDNGDTRLDWNSLPGESYDVMTSTDLIDWQPAAENVRASAYSTKAFLPASPEDRKRFFSIRRR